MRRARACLLAVGLVASLTGSARALTIQVGDACSAELVLALAKPDDRLLAPPEALEPWSPVHVASARFESRRLDAELLFAAAPDALVVSYGMGLHNAAMARRLGIETLVLAGHGLHGLEDNLSRLGVFLDREAEAEALIGALAPLGAEAPPSAPSALYLTAGGATAGAGSQIDALFAAAGLANAAPGPGYALIDSETLYALTPDLVVTGFFDGTADESGWDLARSTILRARLDRLVRLDVSAADLSCEGLRTRALVARLERARRALATRGRP